MFAVGVGPAPFLSLREENSFFEEEMATIFWEEQLVNTHFCERLVSIFCEFYLSVRAEFLPKLPAPSPSTCACLIRVLFLVELQNTPFALVTE